MSKSYLKATINLDLIADELKRLNKRYITIKDFSRYFGMSHKTSGKILRHLEKMGYVKRFSTSTYSIIRDPT